MSDLSFVEVIPASQGLLPDPCPECLWWQATRRDTSDRATRLQWMAQLERTWGSVGLVALEGRETTGSVQFAPVAALPRTGRLQPGAPPRDAVLLFCLRGRIGRPTYETERLLHRAMARLRHRRVLEVYAYARPLGSKSLCGIRNLCGLEFLEANGFQTVRRGPDATLMVADLRGLLPAVTEAGGLLRRLTHGSARPSPATFETP